MSEIRKLPLLPLRGMIVFPFMIIHLDVGRERSVAALEEAMVRDRQILLVAQKNAETDEPGEKDLYDVGTIAGAPAFEASGRRSARARRGAEACGNRSV